MCRYGRSVARGAALAFGSLGMHNDAFNKYWKAAEADPKSAVPRLLWARTLDEVGLYGLAVRVYDAAIELGLGREPASPCRGRGWALARRGRYAKDAQAEDEDYEDGGGIAGGGIRRILPAVAPRRSRLGPPPRR